MYPVLAEDKTIQYLKDHKLKTLIEDIITLIKPLENTILKPLIKNDKLTIQIIYSTTITQDIQDNTTNKIRILTQGYNVTITTYTIHEDRLKILRGFN